MTDENECWTERNQCSNLMRKQGKTTTNKMREKHEKCLGIYSWEFCQFFFDKTAELFTVTRNIFICVCVFFLSCSRISWTYFNKRKLQSTFHGKRSNYLTQHTHFVETEKKTEKLELSEYFQCWKWSSSLFAFTCK